MSPFFMITANSLTIEKYLRSLHEDSQARFGLMTPQHMLEHLIILHKISYGRIKAVLTVSEAESLKMKKYLIEESNPFPKGIKAKGMDEHILPPLKYANLREAKAAYIEAIGAFFVFFSHHPEATTMHPVLGLLNMKEWLIFHNKHITHHFGQFGLLG